MSPSSPRGGGSGSLAGTASYEVRPIGVVRSAIRDRKAMPSLGAPASIEILPAYRAALHRLEKHSHVWVLAWLDQAERDVLQVTPRGVTDRGPEGLHGVFAVRSPARPNPIGLTATRVVALREDSLDVALLDFLDGTPVIDLKPYFVTRDAILAANNAPIGRPLSRDALRESLLLQAVNFHGERCPELALAVRMVEDFRAARFGLGDPPSWHVRAPSSRLCLADALIGMTRATPGRRSLVYVAGSAVEFHHEGAAWVYTPRATLPADAGAILASSAADLFDLSTAPLPADQTLL